MVMLRQRKSLSLLGRKVETDRGTTSTLRSVFGVSHDASHEIALHAAETGEAVVRMGLSSEEARKLIDLGNATLKNKAMEFPRLAKKQSEFFGTPQQF